MVKLTSEDIIEIRKRVYDASKLPFVTWGCSKLIEGDAPALLSEIELLRKENYMCEQAIAEDDATKERLLGEIEQLRNNLRTIEFMTSCEDTKDFAKRALLGDASIKI